MASKLKPQDKIRLAAGNDIRIGNKPYENGIFGTNPNRGIALGTKQHHQGVVSNLVSSRSF